MLMFEDYFITPEEAGSLYRVEDLLGIVKVGDTVQDLRRFVNRWDATLAGMATTPESVCCGTSFLGRSVPASC